MGEKDIGEKLLEDFNDVFADIINVLLFNGESRVDPAALEDSNIRSQYKADDGKLHEQERDVIKNWKEQNCFLAIYGIENQTKSEKMMPFRIFGYEGASYRSQLLHGIGQPAPVVTLVLYFGEEHWNYPKTLKELLKIEKGLENYVNDCKINVVEVSWLEEETIAKFKSDFKVVANFFVRKRKYKNYRPDDPTEIQHVDEVLKLLSVMTGDIKYENLINISREVSNMCEVAERLVNEGKAIGREEGREEGRLAIVEVIKQLKAGDTEETISGRGFDAETIQLAKTCL